MSSILEIYSGEQQLQHPRARLTPSDKPGGPSQRLVLVILLAAGSPVAVYLVNFGPCGMFGGVAQWRRPNAGASRWRGRPEVLVGGVWFIVAVYASCGRWRAAAWPTRGYVPFLGTVNGTIFVVEF